MNNIQLVLRIAIIIFLVEGLIMLGLFVFGPISSPGLEVILDASLLILIISPIISFWVIKPYIKARDLAEQELVRISRQNELLLNTAGEGIFGVDTQGRMTFINASAARMIVDHSPEELIGLSQHEIFHHTRQDGSSYPVEQCPVCATYRDGTVCNTDSEFFWRKDGTGFPVEFISTPILEEGEITGAVVTFRDITERKQMEKELRESEQRFRQVSENSAEWIWETDAEARYTYSNSVVKHMLGYEPEEMIGHYFSKQFEPEQQVALTAQAKEIIQQKQNFHHFTSTMMHKEGHLINVETSGTPIFSDENELLGYRGVNMDVTERKQAEKERQSMEIQLRHAQKLEAVGQLAAGIAHEINTPTQFVNDNTHFLQDAFAGYDRLITSYNRLTTDVTTGGTPSQALLDEVKTLEEEIELDYLKEEIPRAVEQSLEGLGRISRIVQAMKEFSHPGTTEKKPIDLNRAIQTTIDISRSEWKYSAELITELDPKLPLVPVLPGEFNQVMLNLIVNAAHAITDVAGNSEKKGEIRISSRQDGEWVEIRVSDTGSGISKENKKRIFDPFFTTKEVGKGSGQGLAIAWSAIVDKHGGTIEVESEEDKGSTFIIRLPLVSRPLPGEESHE